MANSVFDQRSLSTVHQFPPPPPPQSVLAVPNNGGGSQNNNNNNISNARLGEVILLDGRRVEIKIQPRLFAGDLFDMVASHFNLKEKEYFGLAFLDETGQYSWLNLEKRVLEHEYAQNVFSQSSKAKHAQVIQKEEEDAISTVSAKSKSTSSSLKEGGSQLSSSNRPVHNRRIADLKRKKQLSSNSQQQQQQQLSSKAPLSKKGSLSNLSGSLRAKLQHGANGMLSRLMSSTTSLPQTLSSTSSSAAAAAAAVAPSANSSIIPDAVNSSSSSSTLPLRGDNHHHHHHLKHHSLSSAHSLELSSHPRRGDGGPIIPPSHSSSSSIPLDDPLYDVINEEGGSGGNSRSDNRFSSEVNSVLTADESPNDHHHHHLHHHHLDLPYDKEELLRFEDNNVEEDQVGEEEEEEEEEEEDNRLVLYFLVKYFVESISMLADTTTIELFFLQAKALLINETVQVLDLDTNLTLLALVLQSLYGDISSDSKARHRVHKQQLISSYLLQELATSSTCEDRIIEEYRSLVGTTCAQAIHRFMTLIEKQPTYGVHFYEVKDKSGAPYWLGLSGRGISQFDYEDRRLPRRHFPWKQLENLYFREKKFSIEVRDPKRVVHTLSSINLYENAIEDVDFDDLSSAICDPTTQVSVSRRTFGPCNVTVYVWFAASSGLTKCIWSMAISQHQFYIDRRVTKCHIVCNRSAEEIIASLSAAVNGGDSASSVTTSTTTTTAKSVLRTCAKSKKRYSITTTTSSASTSASTTKARTNNRHHNSLSLGLSRRFSSLGSIHSRTPSSESSSSSSSSSSAVSSTHSLHSLDLPSSISSPPSALSLRGSVRGVRGDRDHRDHCDHLWEATSDSASLFGGAASSTASSSFSTSHHHQQQQFRHSTSSRSMSRMSTSAAAPRKSSSKSLCFRRLRLLETQLSAKLEEVRRLDALEQQILQRAAKAALPPEQVPAMNSSGAAFSTHLSTGNSSHHSISSSSDQSSSSASSTCSASGHRAHLVKFGASSEANIGGNSMPTVHYRSALFGNQQPSSSSSSLQSNTSKLSLRNFVVTGRNSGSAASTSNNTAAATQSAATSDGSDQSGQGQEAQPQQSLKYSSGMAPEQPNNNTEKASSLLINHQRSRSVGPGHKSNNSSTNLPSLNAYSNSLDRKKQQQRNGSKTLQSSTDPAETLQTSENQNFTATTATTSLPGALKTQTLPSSAQKMAQLPSFTSPYVNKFDNSVQSLLVGSGSGHNSSNHSIAANLYSVPNRRTSIALNSSFDDTFLTMGGLKLAGTSAAQPANARGHLIPLNSKLSGLLDQNSRVGERGGGKSGEDLRSNGNGRDEPGGQFLYQFTTTAVTSSVNSVTLSTMSYRYEQRIPPGNSATNTTTTSSIGGFHHPHHPHQHQQQQMIMPPPPPLSSTLTSENVYATIGPGSSNSSDSASLASAAASADQQFNQHLYPQRHPQPQGNFFESSVDELDSLMPPPPVPPSPVEVIHYHHQHNNSFHMLPSGGLPQFARNRFQQPPNSIDEENLALYKSAVLLTRKNSFGNGMGADQELQQQQPRSPGYYHHHAHHQLQHSIQNPKPIQSLQQKQQQQQSSPYTAQIRAQTESLYANYANIGASAGMSSARSSSSGHQLMNAFNSQQQQPQQQQHPTPSSQHHYQNAQSLILTHQLPLTTNHPQQQHQQQLNLQLPSSRSSPVSQSAMSPSRHIYQSVSPLPPLPPTHSSTTIPYTANSASLSTKKPPKTWFDSELDFPTGYVRQAAGSSVKPSVVNSNSTNNRNNNSGTYANEAVLKANNSSSSGYPPSSLSSSSSSPSNNVAQTKSHFAPLAERESSVDHDGHPTTPTIVTDHHHQPPLPSSIIQNRQKLQHPSLLGNSIPTSSSSVLPTYTDSLYRQTPVSGSTLTNHNNFNTSIGTLNRNPSLAPSSSNTNVSPTPSNRSSVSSSASTFIQHTVSSASSAASSSSSSSSDGSGTFIINRSPTNDENSSVSAERAQLMTPTGSVLSLQSAISGSSAVSSAGVLFPVATVAFVPSMAGQGALNITTATAGSNLSTLSPSSIGSGNGGTYHRQTVHHAGPHSMQMQPPPPLPPPPSVPIASCKGNIVEVDVVTVGQCQPGYEEEKPFTISDYYKYSEKYRKAKAAAAAAAAAKLSTESANSGVFERHSIASISSVTSNTINSEPLLTVPKMESTSQLISRLEGLNLTQQQQQQQQQSVTGNSNNNNDSFFATAAQVIQNGYDPVLSSPASTLLQQGYHSNPNHNQQPQSFRPPRGHPHDHSQFSSSMMSTTPTPISAASAAVTGGESTSSDDNNNLPVY